MAPKVKKRRKKRDIKSFKTIFKLLLFLLLILFLIQLLFIYLLPGGFYIDKDVQIETVYPSQLLFSEVLVEAELHSLELSFVTNVYYFNLSFNGLFLNEHEERIPLVFHEVKFSKVDQILVLFYLEDLEDLEGSEIYSFSSLFFHSIAAIRALLFLEILDFEQPIEFLMTFISQSPKEIRSDAWLWSYFPEFSGKWVFDLPSDQVFNSVIILNTTIEKILFEEDSHWLMDDRKLISCFQMFKKEEISLSSKTNIVISIVLFSNQPHQIQHYSTQENRLSLNFDDYIDGFIFENLFINDLFNEDDTILDLYLITIQENQNLQSNQIDILLKTDILIGNQKSLRNSIMFLNKGSTIIELFHWQYQSLAIENLCFVFALKYYYWQNQNPFLSTFLSTIPSFPIAWNNETEIAFWKQQETKVDVNSFIFLFKRISSGNFKISNFMRRKFLIYVPWEQSNNQLIAFRSACAMSKILDRTLVLPYFGKRRESNTTWNYNFDVKDYSWIPFEYYFNQRYLEELPCSIISFSRYQLFQKTGTLNDVLFNPLFTHTTLEQVYDYYQDVLKLKIVNIHQTQKYYQLDEYMIKDIYGGIHEETLALSVLFWGYNFGKKFQYPFSEYHDLMSNPLYANIATSIVFQDRILKLAKELKKIIQPEGKYTAIHVRRGEDYQIKCQSLKQELQSRCFPSITRIVQFLQIIHSEKTIYIISNESSLKEKFEMYEPNYNYFSLKDFSKEVENLDSIEIGQLEQMIGVEANLFVGNLYSSFTRTIIDKRQVESKTYYTF